MLLEVIQKERFRIHSAPKRLCPDEYIARIIPAGFGGADVFVFTTFAWFLLNTANIYTSIARRALDLT